MYRDQADWLKTFHAMLAPLNTVNRKTFLRSITHSTHLESMFGQNAGGRVQSRSYFSWKEGAFSTLTAKSECGPELVKIKKTSKFFQNTLASGETPKKREQQIEKGKCTAPEK